MERGRSVKSLSITFKLTSLVILPIPSGRASNLLLPRFTKNKRNYYTRNFLRKENENKDIKLHQTSHKSKFFR